MTIFHMEGKLMINSKFKFDFQTKSPITKWLVVLVHSKMSSLMASICKLI